MAKTRFADEVIKKVEEHDNKTSALRERMDNDYSRYRLDPFQETDEEGEPVTGYRVYTSNAPRTFADKIISWLTGAELIIRILHQRDDKREDRDANDWKELLLIGMLRSADDRLIARLLPRLRDQLAWYATLRGMVAGRALLVKDVENGGTYVDVTPWDPRHTYWGIGSDGLEWACHKIKRSAEEIRRIYHVRNLTEEEEKDGILLYDYYDRETNFVCMSQGQSLKPRTPHGSDDKVPVFINAVGAQPLIWAPSVSDPIADWAESIYVADRDVYENTNLMISVYLELAARARRPSIKVTSQSGNKVLESDPHKEASEIALAEGENVEPLKALETTHDAAALVGLLSGELQRGSLPYSAYGELQFQLSGYAINTLRQGIDTVLQPRLHALQVAYVQICNLLSDQYASGYFEAMQLSGRGRNREYFSERITPEMIAEGGDPEIELVGQLPEDDMTKMTMAKMAREGPVPLLPDLWIRDRIMGIQSADSVDDMIREQVGERVLPEAMLYSTMMGLIQRGRYDIANIYLGELMFLKWQKLMSRQAMGYEEQGTDGQGSSGPQPQMLPPQAQGIQAEPIQQMGPMVPRGTPRPGAQAETTRLQNIGLVGPRG